MAKCGRKCEVYSRVVGYHRPVQNWNKGKSEEFKDRQEFQEHVSLKNPIAQKNLAGMNTTIEVTNGCGCSTSSTEDSAFY